MNGGPPRILTAQHYDTIADGNCVTSGQYAGCILVDSTYYYLKPADEYWDLAEGAIDRSGTAMTAPVWDLIKSGGQYDWNEDQLYWEDGSDHYRLAGYAGDSVELKKL